MAVTSFQTSIWPTRTVSDTVMRPRNAYPDGPVRKTRPNQKYRDAHIWYDADNQEKFTAYKLLICDVVFGSTPPPRRTAASRRRRVGTFPWVPSPSARWFRAAARRTPGRARPRRGRSPGSDRDAVGLHPARGVHGVAPQVVDELAPADHAGDHRPGVDADAQPQPAAVRSAGDRRRSRRACRAPFGRRPRGDPAWHREAARDHVGVADRLDLLEAVRVGEPVEGREDLVEQRHQLSAARTAESSVKPTMSAKSTRHASK